MRIQSLVQSLAVLLFLGGCGGASSHSGVKAIEDVAAMQQRSDGLFDVLCKDPSREVVSIEQIRNNQVCGVAGGDLAGVFLGHIFGGGDRGESVFFLDAEGKLSGLYSMHFGNRQEPGRFSNLTFDRPTRQLVGNWTDKFGTGRINFTFTQDLLSFAGKWNETGPWDGRRQ
jgi:hypothetical protein